ncbi:MAG: FtsX-like permease family protein [Gammaproteobacteria bacterium]|nr:FtsX-like permease family protein [Gammaproteobacteria bacterium]
MNTTLKITLRRLYRDRLYAAINVAGLSLAFGCCLILALYLHSELTYDTHHVNHRTIFRIVNEFNVNGKVDDFAVTSASLGPMLREKMPEIRDVVRFRRLWNSPMLRYEDQGYFWEDTYLADPNVFTVFTHEVIYGDPATALLEPASIAVSQTFARRYFGDENPIGRVMQLDGREPRKVTLVFADLPENTHLRYDVLFAYTHESLRVPDNVTARRQSLWGISEYTYLVLPENYPIENFPAIASRFYDEEMKPFELPGWSWRAWLQPLRDIHLYSDVGNDRPVGNRFYVYGFFAVAVFVLLVASINYVNLSTARTVKRAREVGMRKILGARRGYLMLQFLTESLLFAALALVFGVATVELALKLTPLNLWLGKTLSGPLLQQPWLLAGLAAFALLTGALSGLYPAFYL